MAFIHEQRIAEAVARRAGKMLLAGSRTDFQVDLKGKNDVVTNVDRAIERYVQEDLKSVFPDDAFLGEEYGAQAVADATRRWVVDPIDGTLNFAQSIPFSCVSIALVDGDGPLVGVIYDPYRDEMFSARRGGGADLNGVSLSVSPTPRIDDAVIATGFPPLKDGQKEDNLVYFTNVTRASRGLRRLGSAALDLAYVAAGRLDAFWEFHLNPWDTLAGTLLIREAGGRVTDQAGAEYTGFEACVVATNGHIHSDLNSILSD